MLPGATIGIVGGGQLGRMIIFEARRMGYRVAILDPDAGGPAGQVADEARQGALDDEAAILDLAAKCDVLTVETEHVPWQILEKAAARVPVRPAPGVLRTIQDRLAQKEFLAAHNFPHPAFRAVDDAASLAAAVAAVGAPAVLKSRHGGYDGKGQARLASPEEAPAAWESIGRRPAVLEAFVRFRAEISVILARGLDGGIRTFPLAENEHRAGILHTTQAPARVSEDVRLRATKLAAGIAEALDHVGALAVEMFLLPDDTLLVNEIAPRVHNSGHYTFGACATSQFEQHLRAVCGLPLGDPEQRVTAAMLNLLGDLWAAGEPDWSVVLGEPGAHLHLYGKRRAPPGRKMGHVLVVGDGEAAMATAGRIHERLTAAARATKAK